MWAFLKTEWEVQKGRKILNDFKKLVHVYFIWNDGYCACKIEYMIPVPSAPFTLGKSIHIFSTL